MPPESSQAAARQRLLGYLVQTLRSLPAELALSLSHPDMPQADLDFGGVLPYGDLFPVEQPEWEYFSIGYWVTGTTPDDAGRYLDLVVRSWTGFGWPTRLDPPDIMTRAADTCTPDGYGLTVQRSVNGYLSLSGTTAPFPFGSTAGDRLPLTIRHE